MLQSMCLGAFQHACAQIYLFPCFLSCLCLDLLAYVLFAMLMFKSISLCALCHVHVSKFTCWLLCHVLLKPFYLLIVPFSCVLALQVWCRSRSCGLGLHPYTQPYIKGFGSFHLCTSMFVCLLLCFIFIFICLDLGFVMLCALHGLLLVGIWGHLLVNLWGHLLVRYTSVMSFFYAYPFSTPCDVLMHAFLDFYHLFGFLCIFACLPTCSSMNLCVVHTPIHGNYGHLIQTYICPPRTPFFV